MATARMSWRKSWIDENLTGSIREDLLPAERSVWADLLDLCGKSRRWGVIERSKGIPFTLLDLANMFKTPSDIVDSAIQKSMVEGRLTKDEFGGLVVTNWAKYQVEPRDHTRAKAEDIPLSPEDRDAAQQAAAARLGYLQPEAARRGIEHKETEKAMKARVKGGV
jgi:hypothetical protein